MALALFSYFAAVIIITGFMVVGLRNPVHSALSLLVLFFHVAGIYLVLDAEFIAAIQIIVYAGAILVLYLFVVMFLNLKAEEGYHRHLVPAVLLGFAVAAELAYIVGRSSFGKALPGPGPAALPADGNTEQIGMALYTDYLFPFEVASVILLVAMIGAILLAKKGIFEEAEGKR